MLASSVRPGAYPSYKALSKINLKATAFTFIRYRRNAVSPLHPSGPGACLFVQSGEVLDLARATLARQPKQPAQGIAFWERPFALADNVSFFIRCAEALPIIPVIQ